MDRRTFLVRGVAIAAVGLAGCAGDSDDDGPAASPTTEPAGTTAGETPTEVPETASPTPTATEAMETTTAPATTTAGDTPTATATRTPSPTPTPTPTPGADADQVVEVGADNSFQFAPDSFQVETGATVLWRWVASNHNVRPDSIPEDSSWEGTPGGDSDTFDAGYTHSHTFEVAGEYEYYCGPHRSAGMVGSFTVE